MIKKLIRQMLAAQTVSALTVSLCLLIDNIMIGRFFGTAALAAYGLANPILLVIGALGSMLSAGVQVVCSKSLGKGSQEETNAGYSSAVMIAGAISVIFLLIVILFRIPLAGLMGANTPELLHETETYMAGFTIGAPASMGALILVPFLQMAGQSNLLIAAVLGMTISDVGFDLLNALVFNGGMFGMGLAYSLSYYIAILIGGWYFLSKKCVFKFSFRLVSRKKIKELFVGGIPTMFGLASSVVLVYVMNNLLLNAGGHEAVAAFSVACTLGNASNCISTGSGGVALTLSGILYHEEDRTGLKEFFNRIVLYAAILGIAVMAVLLVAAPACVGLFIPDGGESYNLAVTALRCYSFGLIPCCINYVIKNCYLGTGKIKTMEVLSVLECAVLPILSALVLGSAAGVSGMWFYFLGGEMLTLILVMIYVWIRKKKVTFDAQDILLLSRELGVPAADLMESDLHDLDEVMKFSRKAGEFCLDRSHDTRLSGRVSLCIEEMGTNIIQHGFGRDKKQNNLSAKLQFKDSRFVLRFRDDCRAFDPVSHMPQPGDEKYLGILLMLKMADEARYTYSLNLNNLTLVLRG